jgi:beta-lactamase class C
MRFKSLMMGAALLAVMPFCAGGSYAAGVDDKAVKDAVDSTVRPIMQAFDIPGAAVGVTMNGQHHAYFYGVASKDTRKPVTADTLFELGSVSKVFTATLTAYAAVEGKLSLSDPASRYLPALLGSGFDKVSLLNKDDQQLMAYFKAWQPAYAPGTYRTYANPSIGMLGMIAARSMNQDFISLMQGMLFPALGLSSSYLTVPAAQMDRYAQGYTKTDTPIRMAPGVLASEAYGVRTTVGDMMRFVEANLHAVDLDPKLQRAIDQTHTGYFRVGGMTQDLIWEQYPYPVDLKTLLAGNSAKVAYEPNPVTAIVPPLPPQQNVLIDKTGSTNGFGAYVAFVPEKQMGIVILANKNFPIGARVTAAHQIFMRLDPGFAPKG